MNKSKNPIDIREARTLRIHPTAQRDGLVKAKFHNLVATFDLDAVGTLHIVEYPISGETAAWVVDGQHRLAALMELGLGDWGVRVEIHKDVTNDAQASALFLKLNNRAQPNTHEQFRNELQAGDPVAVAVAAIVQRHGFTIGRSAADHTMVCPNSLKRVYAMDDGASLDKTLSTITAAWGHTPTAVEGKLIEGLSRVFAVNNGAIDQPAFVKKLAKFSPSRLLGDAKGARGTRGGSLSKWVADIAIEEYNKGRRIHRLDPA